MGHKNPKAKGSEFERAACGRLSLWASGLTRDDIFWRSSTSGGRATFRTRKKRLQPDLEQAETLNQTGDVSAIDPLGTPFINVFFVECKYLKDLFLGHLIYGGRGEIRRYWEEPLAKAKDYGKIPLVIAKENFSKEVLVMTTKVGWELLKGARRRDSGFRVRAFFPAFGLYCFFFRDLLADLEYSRLVQLIESRKTLDTDSIR